MNKKSFHHGNLRQSLVELAASEIEKVGWEALSLRELAKMLGVSRAAPYRHFSNKESLLKALAELGSEELLCNYKKAAETEIQPQLRLRAVCTCYLGFAEQKPELYRLIFASESDWRKLSIEALADEEVVNAEDKPKLFTTFEFFEQLIADALGCEEKQKVRNAALLSWCLIHGNATLKAYHLLDGLTDAEQFESIVLDTASNVTAFKGL